MSTGNIELYLCTENYYIRKMIWGFSITACYIENAVLIFPFQISSEKIYSMIILILQRIRMETFFVQKRFYDGIVHQITHLRITAIFNGVL